MRQKRSIQTIIFDNDGTLSNSIPVIIRATNIALASAGFVSSPDEEIIDGMQIGTVLRMKNHIKSNDDEMADYLTSEFYRQMDLLIGEIPAFPGVSDCLKDLEEKSYPMGLVSNNRCSVIERVLTGNKIRNYFSIIIGEDNAVETKPGPGGLLQACREMDAAPECCVYVGDSETDARSSAAAGMKSIGVTWNTHDAVDVRTLGFTATIDNINQLLPTVLSFD